MLEWDGMDDQGAFISGLPAALTDARIRFAMTKDRRKAFLGHLWILQRRRNYNQESIAKGHTRMVLADGKMYMGSQLSDLSGRLIATDISR
jgi:hypothetical protein